ncbi:MAG: hypothetical protein EHM59_09165 [Betaproteobacteria bacterium]|nr:MAG: hypothetical protein EHM59_09165 [Betaproteobacteria bacterium]
MKKQAKLSDPERVFCEVCLKPVGRSEAVLTEARDFTAYFCSATCYERWRGERAPEPPPHAVQGTIGHGPALDDRLKEAVRQHPKRDEPRTDSVERDDLPPG